MTTPKVLGRLTNISQHPFSPYVQLLVNYVVITWAVPTIILVKMSNSQVNSLIIFITFYLENFYANVAIMMKMWDIATSNQGGRG